MSKPNRAARRGAPLSMTTDRATTGASGPTITRRRSTGSPAADLGDVRALATLVEAALVPDEGLDRAGTTLVAAVSRNDAIDLLLKPIDHHPSQELMGFRAPADWSCLGVATGGWASTYDTVRNGIPQRISAERHRCRILHLVTRGGDAISIYRDGRSEPLVSEWHGPRDEHGGLIDDCLRRALGLATVPPTQGTLELWALIWVDRLLREALAGRLEKASWAAVSAEFSAFDFLDHARDDPRLLRWATDHVERAGELLANAYPWSRVREHCRLGTGPVSFSVELADWMDDGMFARTILETMPPLDQALADLADLIEPDAHRRLLDAIEGWGLFALHDAAEAS